jgi:hypothetical protein
LTFVLHKTKVFIFNGLKNILSHHHLFFIGVEIKIANAYTSLGV